MKLYKVFVHIEYTAFPWSVVIKADTSGQAIIEVLKGKSFDVIKIKVKELCDVDDIRTVE